MTSQTQLQQRIIGLIQMTPIGFVSYRRMFVVVDFVGQIQTNLDTILVMHSRSFHRLYY